MINNGQSTLLLYCCEDVKSHRSGGDTVPLIYLRHHSRLSVINHQPSLFFVYTALIVGGMHGQIANIKKLALILEVCFF